jgi:hypothetical protein
MPGFDHSPQEQSDVQGSIRKPPQGFTPLHVIFRKRRKHPVRHSKNTLHEPAYYEQMPVDRLEHDKNGLVFPSECDQQYTAKPKTAEEIQHRCLQKPSRQRRQAPVSLPPSQWTLYVCYRTEERDIVQGWGDAGCFLVQG